MNENKKTWSPAKASTWLKNYADDVAGDAYKDGGIPFLYAAAGAAYYAVEHGVGYSTREEFSEFFLEHMGMGKDFLADTLEAFDRKEGKNA